MYSVFYDYAEFILYLYFSYFSHPLLGGAGIRGIITPVYIICVFLQYILLCCCIYCCICSITSEHLLLYFSCQFQIPPMCVQCTEKESSERAFISTPWYQYFLSTAFLYLKDFITTFCCYLHPFCTYNPLSNCVNLIKQKMNE